MKRLFHFIVLPAAFLAGTLQGFAYQDTGSTAPADNTKVNQRDKQPSSATADQQKDNQTDLELTRKIRRSLVQDKTLSSNAHNVKIITANGMVVLKGPVNSAEEKQSVEAKAAEIAGADKVTSQIDVVNK